MIATITQIKHNNQIIYNIETKFFTNKSGMKIDSV